MRRLIARPQGYGLFVFDFCRPIVAVEAMDVTQQQVRPGLSRVGGDGRPGDLLRCLGLV